jgi:hypothetical protein
MPAAIVASTEVPPSTRRRRRRAWAAGTFVSDCHESAVRPLTGTSRGVTSPRASGGFAGGTGPGVSGEAGKIRSIRAIDA